MLLATTHTQHDVLALSVLSSSLYAGCANGWIKQWDLRTFKLENAWEGHRSIVLSSEVCGMGGGGWLLTGGNDASLKVRSTATRILVRFSALRRALIPSLRFDQIWDIRAEDTKDSATPAERGFQGEFPFFPDRSTGGLTSPFLAGELFHTLANFVAIKTIADDAHREDCRQGALYLKRALRGLGAETVIVRIVHDSQTT